MSIDKLNSRTHNHQVERALGAAAAALTWLGWLTVSPVLGFPTLGTAGMVNRALFGKIPEAGHNPDFWLGWVIVVAGLVAATAVFFLLEGAHVVRATIPIGVTYGAVLWLLAGVVVMPLLGLTEPSPPHAPGFQPADPMQATLMMYTLGPLAAAGSLIAWMLFGAILGATGSTRRRRETAAMEAWKR